MEEEDASLHSLSRPAFDSAWVEQVVSVLLVKLEEHALGTQRFLSIGCLRADVLNFVGSKSNGLGDLTITSVFEGVGRWLSRFEA